MKIKFFTLFLASMLMSVMLFAQVTTSGLSGKVVGKDNLTLPGATVTAIHVPTGTKYVTVSNANGQFSMQGMKAGGPYTINISFIGYSTASYRDITLSLGDMFNLNAALTESANSLAEVVIMGSKASSFRNLKTGAVSNITNVQMKAIPSMNRTLGDYTKLSPFSNGGGSYLGKDAYTTNITVDGANFNNNFGLSSSNLPGASGEPISMEAIDEIQVSVAPFDVRQSNFTGAGINAITKSGTNQFKGSAYTFYRNQSYNGTLGRDSANGNARKYTVSPSSKKTYGVTFGGPIIKNKLFFFINGETDRTLSPGNTLLAMDAGRSATDPNVNANVSADSLKEFSNFLKQKYGYETGPYENWGGDQDKNDKLLVRLDWNINKANKFTIRYNYSTSSTPSRPSSSGDVTPSIIGGRSSKSGGMSYQNSQYFTSSTLHSITAELNSRLGSRVDNKLLFAYTKYGQPRTTPSSIFPMIDIMNGTLTGNVRMTAGYELFSYMNNVDNNTTIVTDNLTYLWKKHSFTLGGSMEHQYFANSYLRQGTGYYRFKNLKAFENYANGVGAGLPFNSDYDPIGFAYTYPINGFTSPVAELSFRQWSAYLQDEWKATENFKVTGGVRIDLPQYLNGAVNNPALYNYSFRSGEMVDLSTWPKAQILWSPRLGFNWDVMGNKALTLRGGSGIFTGRIPFVWFTNQPTNSGMLQYQLAISYVAPTTSNPNPIQNSQLARLPLYNDASKLLASDNTDNIKDIFPQQNVVGGKIAGIDKNFKLPQVWRTSIGVDVKFLNMLLSLDGIYTKDINSIYFDNINMNPATTTVNLGGTLIPYYNSAARYITSPYQNVVVMRNTKEGQGYTLAAKLDLPKIAGFSGTIAYSKTWGEEVTNKSGSDPFSAWQYRLQNGDPNEQSLGLTANNMPNRLVASVNYGIKYNRFETNISVFYTGNSGYAYSYYFSGDANADGTTSNDLMYIPKNENEYIWASPADAQAYWTFAQQDPYLSKHKGEMAQRNAAYEPWYSRFDVRITQDINVKVGKENNKLSFVADFINFGNLINHNWGLNKSIASGASSPLSVTGRDAATGLLKVSMRKVGANYMTSSFQDPTSISGLWGIQIGLKYTFN